MKLFRSYKGRKTEEEDPVQATIGDIDDESNYPYEDEVKAAAEMESILGNAVSITERNHGSLLSLRSRTFDSLGSQEDLSFSDGQLQENDSHSYVSRSSSLQSAASVTTFVKVDRGDPVTLTRKFWEAMLAGEQNHGVPDDVEFANDPSASLKKVRSWSKLRQEIKGEERSLRATTRTIEGKENTALSRSMSMGRKGLSSLKKNLKESSRCISKSQKEVSRSLASKMQKYRGEDQDPPIRTRCAKDYDVEVSLQEQKSFWNRKSSRPREEFRSTRSSRVLKSKRRQDDGADCNRRNGSGEFANDSCGTPVTVGATDDLSTDVHEIKYEVTEQNPNVVVVPTADVLFESLEVICCHQTDTLDRITAALPPHI